MVICIAVVGANGAGKCTLIKLLAQEIVPDSDTDATVWKHMNLRIAYVAQHSLHHVVQHLDILPVDYMKRRFSAGVEKEDLANALTDEKALEKKERKYGCVDQVLGRLKSGDTMDNECTCIRQNSLREPNKYIALEMVVEMGLVQRLDSQCDSATRRSPPWLLASIYSICVR